MDGSAERRPRTPPPQLSSGRDIHPSGKGSCRSSGSWISSDGERLLGRGRALPAGSSSQPHLLLYHDAKAVSNAGRRRRRRHQPRVIQTQPSRRCGPSRPPHPSRGGLKDPQNAYHSAMNETRAHNGATHSGLRVFFYFVASCGRNLGCRTFGWCRRG